MDGLPSNQSLDRLSYSRLLDEALAFLRRSFSEAGSGRALIVLPVVREGFFSQRIAYSKSRRTTDYALCFYPCDPRGPAFGTGCRPRCLHIRLRQGICISDK